MTTALRVDVRSMSYPGQPRLIEDLCFSLPDRSVVSLLGRSGCGKTTLLRIIAGLETRYTGKVVLGEARVEAPTRAIQLVFQDYRLLPWKTVAQNVEFALADRRSAGDVEQMLASVNLMHRRNAWPKSLSGGESGRVALARALCGRPKVLLLDEPFAALDPFTRVALQEQLVRLLSERPTTTIIVSHSIPDAIYLSDIVYVLGQHPLRVMEAIHVDAPRPRHRDDPVLLNMAADLTQRLVTEESV